MVGMPSVQKMSLTATGTPAQRPARRPSPRLARRATGTRRARPRPPPRSRRRSTPRRTARRPRCGEPAPPARELEQLAAASGLTPAGTGRGMRRSAASGASSRIALAVGERARLVGAQHVLERDHVRGRLDPVEVELGDALDVLEDRATAPIAMRSISSSVSSSRARRATWRTCSRSITPRILGSSR